MAYILTAVMLLSSLSGCSRMGDIEERNNATAVPAATATPVIITPDPKNGMVRDEDGFIEDNDTGRVGANPANETPRATARPKTGNAAGTARTPLPSPSPQNGMD